MGGLKSQGPLYNIPEEILNGVFQHHMTVIDDLQKENNTMAVELALFMSYDIVKW